MKKVAIIQSNYIPWKGYFDIIHDVDLFIFLDDVQYTVRDWRNRNKIKTQRGVEWLTIPVGDDRNRLIREVEISDPGWGKNHWAKLCHSYSKAPYFKHYKDFFEHFYLEINNINLSQLNQYLITNISKNFLGIQAQFQDSSEIQHEGQKLELIINLLQQVKADIYLSGPSAKNYIDEQRFIDVNIELQYKDYSGYPEYPQMYKPFEHAVTIVDLLFNCGPDTPYYIWGWREEAQSKSGKLSVKL